MKTVALHPSDYLPMPPENKDYGIGFIGCGGIVLGNHLPAYRNCGYRSVAACNNINQRRLRGAREIRGTKGDPTDRRHPRKRRSADHRSCRPRQAAAANRRADMRGSAQAPPRHLESETFGHALGRCSADGRIVQECRNPTHGKSAGPLGAGEPCAKGIDGARGFWPCLCRYPFSAELSG